MAVVTGCSAAASDHERLGDAAYRDGQFGKAVTEYQAAQRDGSRSRIWAKVGAAALRAGQYQAAVDAFASLASEDPTRVLEAAVGLDRAASGALELVGGSALAARAALALRRAAPSRPLGRLSMATLANETSTADELGLLPAALATAGNARVVDSLLLRYGNAQRATTACEAATGSYQSLLRRTADSRLRREAREGLAECALLLGQDAINARRGADAEGWFEMALGVATGTDGAPLAQLGVGDARMLQGNALGAAVAYQAVVSSEMVSDSLRAVAISRLNGLGAASPEPPTDGAA